MKQYTPVPTSHLSSLRSQPVRWLAACAAYFWLHGCGDGQETLPPTVPAGGVNSEDSIVVAQNTSSASAQVPANRWRLQTGPSGKPVITRSSELAFEAVGIAGADHGFIAWRNDGRTELRDPQGQPRAIAMAGIKAMERPLPGETGWYLLGSLFEQREETPAVVFLSTAGRADQPSKLPTLLWSIVEYQGNVYAGGSRGQTFLRQQATFQPVTLKPAPAADAPVTLRIWANELVPCTRGTLEKHGDHNGYCSAAFGRVSGIWQTPPIACADYLLVDTRAEGAGTSPWSRHVLQRRDGTEITRSPATGNGKLACFAGGLLLDAEPPGKLLALPELSPIVEQLCPAESRDLAVSGSHVMCLLDGRAIEMRSLKRE